MRLRGVTEWVRRNAAILLIALAVVAGYSYWHQLSEQHDQAERLNRISACQQEYNRAFAEQLTIRSGLFQRSDETRNDLLGGVAALILAPRDPNESAEVKKSRDLQFRTLFENYLKATQEVEDARRNTPLPPIPDCK